MSSVLQQRLELREPIRMAVVGEPAANCHERTAWADVAMRDDRLDARLHGRALALSSPP